MATIKTKKEAEEQISIAEVTAYNSKFPGMTYEDGIVAALTWMIGETDTPPMED